VFTVSARVFDAVVHSTPLVVVSVVVLHLLVPPAVHVDVVVTIVTLSSIDVVVLSVPL
jgi:hypothetical protein